MENIKTFEVESIGQSGIEATWVNRLKGKTCEDLVMSIPPEFEGPGGTYSPEDLYALSLMNCYLATFKYIAEKSKLRYEHIKGEALLSVGKGDEKAPWMEKIKICITLEGCENKDRAILMLEKTKSHCMIINSVKTKLVFEFFAN
jgi:organic hydroperoxide reductase OsmC/OhrA